MIRTVSARRFHTATVGAALTLSLSMLAGCATPVVPAPATTAPTGAADTTATPAGEAAAPAMPAPAAVTATTLNGVATFKGEPVSGYAVTVLDARTGAPVALKDDLAGATGLAVLNKNLVTDAQGHFALHVVGLSAGQSLRVLVSSGNGTLESVVTSNLQSLGAKGYQVQQVGTVLTVTELTTAIARAARGVLLTTGLLSPEAAAPVLAKLATEMAGLTTKLEGTLQANPNFANSLVTKDGDAALLTLVRNANALKDLTASIAGLVADVAKSAGANPRAEAALKANLARVEFAGTVLRGALGDAGFRLTNNLNGNSVDAGSGDLGNVTTQTTSSSSSGGGSGPVFFTVNTTDELITALQADKHNIRLGANLDVIDTASNGSTLNNVYHVLNSPSTTLTLPAGTTIDGNGYALYASNEGYLVLQGTNYTVKNTTLAAETYMLDSSAAYRVASAGGVRFDDVTVDSKAIGESTYMGLLEVDSALDVTLTGCHFRDILPFASAPLRWSTTGGNLTLKDCDFNDDAQSAISFDSAPTAFAISGSEFTGYTNGIDFNGDLQPSVTMSGNTFLDLTGDAIHWEVDSTSAPDFTQITQNTFSNVDVALNYSYRGDQLTDAEAAFIGTTQHNSFTNVDSNTKYTRLVLN